MSAESATDPVRSTNADVQTFHHWRNGNQLDALGVCGGGCEADADADGICDDIDDCVGEFDACGDLQWPRDLRVRMP